MIIKRDRHIFREIHEVRKGLCADWLGEQSPITRIWIPPICSVVIIHCRNSKCQMNFFSFVPFSLPDSPSV